MLMHNDYNICIYRVTGMLIFTCLLRVCDIVTYIRKLQLVYTYVLFIFGIITIVKIFKNFCCVPFEVPLCLEAIYIAPLLLQNQAIT